MGDQLTHTPLVNESPPVTLKDLIRKIIRARFWIIASVIIILTGTIYVTYSTPPIYQATVSLMIEKSSKAQAIFNFGVNENFKISDEVAVIKSRIIAEDVVESLWKSNKRNRLYVFGTKVFIPRGQRLRRPIKKLLTFGQYNPEENKPPKYDEPYSNKIGTQFYRNVINTINVTYRRGTNIIQITTMSPHPYEAALLANTVASAYQKRDKEWSSNESMNLKSFLQDRLDEKDREMEEIEQNIENYKRENEIYDLDGNVSNMLNNLTNIESKFNNNNLEINILLSQKKYLAKQLSSIEKDLAVQILNSINAQLFALRTQVNEKEAELVRNSTVYGSNHEAVLKTKDNLSNLKNQLENKTNELISAGLSIVDPLEYRQKLLGEILKFETNLNLLETKSREYQALIFKYKNDIKILPEKQSFLGKLNREKAVLSNTYSYMRQKMEEARVSMASEPGKVRIVNQAEPPKEPISPDIPRNLSMALFIGFIIGFVINLAIEYFDNTIKSVEFIERKKLPVLGIIPSIEQGQESYSNYRFVKKGRKQINQITNGRKGIGNLQRRLITHEDPKSPISEAYRSLRTSLMYTKKGEKGTIMVSSPGPGEGKTTTIINLAITYANLGKKTLLVDGDLRKPVLHKVFNGNNEKGITHLLSGIEEKWESVIQPTDIENLNIIYSGVIPPNPSELLGSETMKKLVEILKENYEVILFDAPPIMAVTDAVVLSRLINQFILVVRFGNTDKDSIDHSLNSLSHVNTYLTGVVLNDLNKKNSYYSKNYYSYNNYNYSIGQQS
ncbi:MAG: polysaccharide biosynthesis tyrosine autokinase [Candidatus Marinimicrobia bacterium]|nr:polysaccharide biosynthesis tyrosine autokinase [Candidatus Neomarinimicrobiota bacterium]